MHKTDSCRNKINALHQKYPPSDPCTCSICISYCKRPGWWTVEEAVLAIAAWYGPRMMLELSPGKTFGVLSPAFKGNECNYAFQVFSSNGCTFLQDDRCELFGSGLVPLECRYCHHERKGKGIDCHHEIEKDWNSELGKRLIVRWGNLTGFWKRQGLMVVEKETRKE
jgi:hypothetical protein